MNGQAQGTSPLASGCWAFGRWLDGWLIAALPAILLARQYDCLRPASLY